MRACRASDLAELAAAWPGQADVHHAHFVHQSAGHTTYLIAWDGDQPLGELVIQWTGCVAPNAAYTYPRAIEINHLHVRKEHRGRGVGTQLMAEAEALITRRGDHQSAVSVDGTNVRAARLYLRLGYARTGIVDASTYTWTDAGGVEREANETNELLVKELDG